MTSPVPDHQAVVVCAILVLTPLINTLGGRLFVAPLDVYFDEDNVPQPDVIWVAPNSKCVIGDKRLIGAPDLIVEVFSPGTIRTDKKKKFRLYEKYGVREYWMIDPTERYIEIWQYDGSKFVPAGVYEAGDTFASAVMNGQTINVQALFGG